MIRLSILIPSLPQRSAKLAELLSVLCPQLPDDVEIIVNIDKGKSIGRKRNELVNAANGVYLIFIDDDDMVSEDYVKLILGAMTEKPDVISIEGVYHPVESSVGVPFVQNMNNPWIVKDNTLIRGVTHISAVKKAIAILCPFPETNMGEDRVYEQELKAFVKTCIHIAKPIYTHRYNSVKEYII